MAKRTSKKPEPHVYLREVIEKHSQEQGISVRQLSKRIGIAYSTLNKLISGSRPITKLYAEKIADGIGLPRVEMYIGLGWLTGPSGNREAETLVTRFREIVANDPAFVNAMNKLFALSALERNKVLRLIEVALT